MCDLWELRPGEMAADMLRPMSHDFSYVTSMTGSAGSHVTTARSSVENIHDAATKDTLRALIEAVGVTVDALNQLVETLK